MNWCEMAQRWRHFVSARPLVSLGWLYLVQGIPYGLQDKFIPIQLRSLGLQYSSVSLLKLLLLPWLLKGLWAPVVEVAGGQQRWLVASLVALAMAALAGTVTSPENLTGVGVMLLGLNVFSAVQDVAVDGFALLVMPDHLLGLASTIQVVLYKVGCLVGGAGLTHLLALTSWPTTFTLLALLYALTAAWGATCINTGIMVSAAHPQKEEEFMNTSQDSLECDTNSIKKSKLSISRKEGQSQSQSVFQVKRVFSILQEVFYSPGIIWLTGYVLVYKMGERGAANNMPLYLLDKGLTKQELAFWSGTVCQGLSIVGSTYGGMILAKANISIKAVLIKHSTYRLISVILQCLTVFLLDNYSLENHTSFPFVLGIASMCWLSYSSGVISTASFTLMMKMSRECSRESQASHYSVVASLEVAGKLLFASMAGIIIDHYGLLRTFSLFAFLCTLPIMVLTAMPTNLAYLKSEKTIKKC